MVQEYLKESGLHVLDHPPYSPDLSPCDFWLFPRLKEMLAGWRFESRCGISSAVYQCLQHIPKEDNRIARFPLVIFFLVPPLSPNEKSLCHIKKMEPVGAILKMKVKEFSSDKNWLINFDNNR